MIEALGMMLAAFAIGLFAIVVLANLSEVHQENKLGKPIRIVYVVGGLCLAGFLFGATLFLILYTLGIFG